MRLSGRLEASVEIKQRVTALSTSTTTQLDKMKVLAQFVQQNIRYVAIELFIVSSINNAHAACTNLLNDAIVAERPADELGRGGHRARMLGPPR